uniref:Peptidase C14 caspase domain-containing protein n=1 Tax=Chromera velia CCMP2878 TaxID=1169474 RepID=A0A0G4IAB1_9ALVE|eukprot:Cvel_12439.t1-p1 / transcript=Cvel_12439.t1 / gene=Cvel_12439 / organism=Chromera_velia_CCMP2878 / gene_product=Metacaspase-2, putative / transcript_product=Metacaspase-2, putative / location=Cvel_scaffold814:45196-47438(-) / protein_length=304 / sequence_SO=supercontig / SO=protein_coding / is_pseudo=false
MSSTWRQRFYGEERENAIKKPFKGDVHMLFCCLNYAGTESPLGCIVDGERLTDAAAAKGVSDITKLYDEGESSGLPTKENLINTIKDLGSRCKPGDYFVFHFSGHGTGVDDEDGDEEDGQDEALCLMDEGLLTDDELAALLVEAIPQDTLVLLLVDACASGTILDVQKPGMWGGRKVACFSGCQDSQCSQDTGNGGAMTNALLEALEKKSCKKRRKAKTASVQFIFNRMVDKLDEAQEEGEEDEDEEDCDEEYDEDEEEYDEEEEEEDAGALIDPISGEERDEGQDLNLSWCGGCDPTKMPFPF